MSVVQDKVTTWQIDRAHTQVGFAVRHLMISTVRGQFSDVSGTLTVPDDDFGRAQLEARIGVASIDTRESQRDGHLKSADFFDVERYPAITFKSRSIGPARSGDRRYIVTGDLTLHGVTREIALDAVLEGEGKDPRGHTRAGFSASGKINRKDFGLTWNQLLEAGGVAVGDEVKISIDAEVVAQGS